MTIFRSILTTTTAIAATALPATAYAASSLSTSASSSSSSSSGSFSKFLESRFISPQSTRLELLKNLSSPPSAVQMDIPKSSPSQEDLKLPDLMTEFMVDMKCEGCVSAVKSKLETLEGVKSVEADLSNQVVRILGSSPVIAMKYALEETGRKARLIGQGVPEGSEILSSLGHS